MNTQKSRPLWIVLASLTWGLVVLTGYYYVHKPLTMAQATAFGRSILDLALALALSGLAGGIGRCLMPARSLSPLERFSLQAALGWGLLGLGWFGVGLLGLYQTWLAWAALMLGWAITWRSCLAWAGGLRALGEAWVETGRLGKFLAVGASLLIVGRLFFALAPPVMFDTLWYHLVLPNEYLQSGRFEFLFSNPLWGRTQLTEMLFTWVIALRGWETATVLGWCIAIVLLVGIFGLVARQAGPTAGWLAVIALLAGETFRGMLNWGYVDGLVALYGLGVLVLLMEWVEQTQGRAYLWVGVFIGLAIGVKLTALVLLPVAGLVFLGWGWRSRGWIPILSIVLLLKNYHDREDFLPQSSRRSLRNL